MLFLLADGRRHLLPVLFLFFELFQFALGPISKSFRPCFSFPYLFIFVG